MLKSGPLQSHSGAVLGAMCTVDQATVEYCKQIGCLQLIEQIHQASLARQKQQEARQRQLQQQQVIF